MPPAVPSDGLAELCRLFSNIKTLDMMYYPTVVWLLCLLANPLLSAQDAGFSQFTALPSQLNPGLTGSGEGLSLHTAWRNQWQGIEGNWRTSFASLEMNEPKPNFSFGLSALQDREGIGLLTTRQISLLTAYPATVDERANTFFRLGFRFSYSEKSVDWERFTFSDELDPVFGAVHPTSAIPPEGRVTFWDAGAGGVFGTQNELRLNGRRRELLTRLGAAVHHLPNTGESLLLNPKVKTPLRMTFHAGAKLEIADFQREKLTCFLMPQLRWERQGRLSWWSGGATVLFQRSRDEMGISAGAFFHGKKTLPDRRQSNALSLVLGYKFPLDQDGERLVRLGISYDAVMGGLGAASGNVLELTLALHFKKATLFGTGSRRYKGKCLPNAGS